MSKEKNIQESGGAGKPGEATAVTRASLSAGGVADLLKAGFAEDAGAPEPEPKADETPADGAEAGGEHEQAEPPGGAEPAAEGAEPGETAEGEEPAAEEPGEEGAEAQLTEAEQAALDQWKEEGEGKLPPELQKLVAKRIGKLAEARDTAKAEAAAEKAKVEALQQEVDALKADPKRPGQALPATVMDEKALGTVEQAAKGFLADAEDYLDDAATPEQRQRIEKYLKAEGLDGDNATAALKRRVREVNAFVREELPQQRQRVQAFRQAETTATAESKKWYGRLDDPATPEAKQAQEILKLMPELRGRTPSHHFAQGTYVLGLKVIQHLKANGYEPTDAFAALDKTLATAFPKRAGAKPAAAQPKPAGKAPPKVPTGGAAAPAGTRGRVTRDEAARQEFSKSGYSRQSAVEMARAALSGS